LPNFDEQRFLRIQSGAVDLAPAINRAIAGILASGAENVFFLGAGGAAILMHPAAQLQSDARDFASLLKNPQSSC
jgi:fructoselysine-6-phosphate deglycase